MIEVALLCLKLGQFTIDDVCFRIPSGKYGVLMGKTGCGKTSILEAICGLKPVIDGKVYLNGHDVTHLNPALRGIGFVPQDGALFSSMTVHEHLAFALSIRRWNRKQIDTRVHELAEWLGITYLLSRNPKGLSGGERQRVALGRALSAQPSILCLDEPLSALDDETRDEMCDLLKRVQHHLGVTTLHITHSLSEAKTLADYLFRIKDGRVIQEIPEPKQPEYGIDHE